MLFKIKIIFLFYINFACIHFTTQFNSSYTRARKPSENEECYWYNIINGLCYVTCLNIDSIYLPQAMDYFQSQHSQCVKQGYHLKVTPHFPNYIMSAKWYGDDSSVRIKILDIELQTIMEIKPYAFSSKTFQTIEQLMIRRLGVNKIENGIFNDLLSLKELTIEAYAVTIVNSNILEPIRNTLQSLQIIEVRQMHVICLNGITGNAQMSKLTSVNLSHNNFMDTIGNSSFKGLIAVRHLDLSNSKITELFEFTFDPIANTIETIDLQSNELLALPELLFTNVLSVPNSKAKFKLSNNTFICDCNLQIFKYFLMGYPNYFDDVQNVLCKSPLYNNTSPIIYTEFCYIEIASPVLPSTTTQIIMSTKNYTAPIGTTTTTTIETTTTPTIETTTTTIANDIIPISCEIFNSNNTMENFNTKKSYYVDQHKYSIKAIKVISMGNVFLEIDGDLYENDLIYFFIDQTVVVDDNANMANVVINCISNITNSILLRNVNMNVSITFCIIKRNEIFISPFACRSDFIDINRYDDNELWISEEKKVITTVMVLFVIIICFLLSILIGVYVQYNCCTRNKSAKGKIINFDSSSNNENNNDNHVSKNNSMEKKIILSSIQNLSKIDDKIDKQLNKTVSYSSIVFNANGKKFYSKTIKNMNGKTSITNNIEEHYVQKLNCLPNRKESAEYEHVFSTISVPQNLMGKYTSQQNENKIIEPAYAVVHKH